MNKQELIEKYQRIYQVSNEPGYRSDPFSRGEDAGSSRCSFEIIDDLKKLDETQKVKVPAFVAEYVEWCHFEEITLWEVSKSIRGMPEEVWKWLNSSINQDIFARAMLDGYEVDEERKWVVKVGNLYFCGWEDTTAQFVMNTVLGEDESIIKYKNEGTASSVAKNLGGTVEKV